MFQEAARPFRRATLTAFAVTLAVAVTVPAQATNPQKHQKRQKRPVKMGTSGGNIDAVEIVKIEAIEFPLCFSGTLGALLEDQEGRYFVLSSNFAIAQVNKAQLGGAIVQPGLLQTLCDGDRDDAVGTLSGKKKIKFIDSGTNTVDLAIAETNPDLVNASGEIINIGVPSSATKAAVVGMAVKKAGAGSGVTKGTVSMTNATIEVVYPQSAGADFEVEIAIFKQQIIVLGAVPGEAIYFPDDTGSLLVEDKSDCPAPVGLVFAATASGDVMAANKIGKVLNAAKKLKPKGGKTVVGCGQGSSASAAYVHRDEERLLRRAARVQRQVENRMLDLPGVVGIGVTLDERRRPVIMLLLESENEETRHAIPAEIDGLVTDVRVTGPFLAN